MKCSGNLSPIGDVSIQVNRVVINPNDGYDLGLLSTSYPVKIHVGVSPGDFESGEGYKFDGSIEQANECKIGGIELNLGTLKQLGKPSSIKLYLDGNKLLLSTTDS